MSDKVRALTDPPEVYANWLADLKGRIHAAQLRAALAVNTGPLRLYWQIGRDILGRQAKQGWGGKLVERLAHDLREVFPDLGGFSRANLMYMRAFAKAWPKEAVVQQAVGQIPWGTGRSHSAADCCPVPVPGPLLGSAAAGSSGWVRELAEGTEGSGVNGRSGPAAATASLCAQMPSLSSSGTQLRPPVQRG